MGLNVNLLGNLTFDELVREAEATENALAMEIVRRLESGEIPSDEARLDAAYGAGYEAGRAAVDDDQ